MWQHRCRPTRPGGGADGGGTQPRKHGRERGGAERRWGSSCEGAGGGMRWSALQTGRRVDAGPPERCLSGWRVRSSFFLSAVSVFFAVLSSPYSFKKLFARSLTDGWGMSATANEAPSTDRVTGDSPEAAAAVPLPLAVADVVVAVAPPAPPLLQPSQSTFPAVS